MKSYAYVVEHWTPLQSTKSGFGWTTALPENEGAYWVQLADKEIWIVGIHKLDDGRLFVALTDYFLGEFVRNFDVVAWLGPLPEPRPLTKED